MSFTVQPNAFFIAFTSSSGTDANATRRCGVSGAFHGVRGVLNGVPPDGRLGSRRTRVIPTAPRTRFGIASASASGSGRRSREMIACRTSSKSDGLCSGFQSSATGGSSTGVGFEIQDAREQARTRHAVDRRVVHAGDDRDRAVLDTLDDPELPERSRPIEGTARDVADDVGELLGAARGRHRDVANVVVEVEVGVVEPDRSVQIERDVREPATELRQHRKPRREMRLDLLEGVAARHRRRVQEHHRLDLHVRRGRLQVQKRRVHSAQAPHRSSSAERPVSHDPPPRTAESRCSRTGSLPLGHDARCHAVRWPL